MGNTFPGHCPPSPACTSLATVLARFVFNSTILASNDTIQPAMMSCVTNSLEGIHEVQCCDIGVRKLIDKAASLATVRVMGPRSC